jgi:hypothetical protein
MIPPEPRARLFDACARHVKILEDCGSWAEQPQMLGLIVDSVWFGTDS